MSTVSPIEEMLEQAEACLLRQQPQEADALVRSVLRSAPDHADALHLAGMTAAMACDPAAAQEYLVRAVWLEPARVAWIGDLALTLYSAGRQSEAEEQCHRVLALDPENQAAHVLLAKMMARQGRDHRARQHIRALALVRPDDPDMLARLALAEYSVGNYAETIRVFRKLIEAGAADRNLYSEYVSALLYDPEQTGASLRKELEEWSARFCRTRTPRPISRVRAQTGRKLRIGYLSGEFGATPSRHFLLPILRCHDRTQFEITCYHTRPRDDVHTARFHDLADRWRNCSRLDDQDLARQIEADEIDIAPHPCRWHFRIIRRPQA